ncbi:two-component system response regulator FlrC [Azospirillum agricola]|uniref:response regulator n=1 Tax=Azospirillum agricola TaxID=1720247 RepID=UPI001AE3F0CB|nr:response regulator [Azospirillum agricola]MBP2232250.1 two-component system response regulator FlrC [Azospirillum agricola]
MPESPHILLVDDEVLAIMALEQGLVEEGFRVTTAFNGKMALERWRGGRFDAVVTDLRMPVMAGDELIRNLRGEAPDLPVVVVSGYATPDLAERLKASFQAPIQVMSKPVRVEEIMGTLRTMLPAHS